MNDYCVHDGLDQEEKRLDSCGPVLEWFKLSVVFLNDEGFSFTYFLVLDGVGSLNILESSDFVSVCDCFLQVGADSLSVYTNRSLSNLSTVNCRTDTTAFFEDIDLGLDISVLGLMSFTLAELQAIVLALECIPPISFVKLFSDNQSALDACKSELSLTCSNFHNQYWVKHCHIVNVIYCKNLKVNWHKIKSHSGILENECTDMIAGNTSLSGWYLPYRLSEHFIVADSSVVFGNSRYFIGSGFKFLAGSLLSEVDWLHSSLVWHPNLQMAAGFMLLFHEGFVSPAALDYVFSCKIDNSVQCQLLEFYVDSWKTISGFFHSSSSILQMLFSCVSDSFLVMALYKGFIFNDWFCKTVTIFHNSKVAGLEIVKFVHSLSLDFRSSVWSVYAKYCVYMKKNGLILLDGLVPVSVSGLASELSAGMVKLLGIANVFSVRFGFCKPCLFFLGVDDLVLVYIAA
ncbi:hypothetical protein G9A89_001553 [Geosiphon pyriformis]|nr:hypothetical protein G9A89_001553 [Geosiphon pyriformis]